MDQNELILSAYDLRAQGKFDESYEQVQQVSPAMPGYRALMGWHLLRLGKFLEGMQTMEPEFGIYRAESLYHLPQTKRLEDGMEVWGKKIFFALEGGFGDEVAYFRFAQLFAEKGAEVVVGCSPRLAPVLARTKNMSQVVNVKTVNHNSYDYYVNAMSSIRLLGIKNPTTLPYLEPLESEVTHIRGQIEGVSEGKKKIGIHWQGNWAFDYTEKKSIPAELMIEFAKVGKLYSLQRDQGSNHLPPNNDVFDAEAGDASWERTIATMSLMDCIITNDNSTAHLGGALGKPTLLILPHAPHHYWLPLTQESLWYPSITCFRQPTPGDWKGAIDEALLYLQNNPNV